MKGYGGHEGGGDSFVVAIEIWGDEEALAHGPNGRVRPRLHVDVKDAVEVRGERNRKDA
jgi:hypothetical protein